MKIDEKLMHIQTEIKAPKNLFNSFGKYKYRNAEGICEAVKPYLMKEKCSLTLEDEVIAVGDRIYIRATATLTDCESNEQDDSIFVTAFAREADEKKGMDASQITGTASSYARKYALNGLFLLDDTKDADTDEYHNQTKEAEEQQKAAEEQTKIENSKISEVKLKALIARCEKEDVSTDKIMKLYKLNSLADLTELKYRNINDHWESIKKA